MIYKLPIIQGNYLEQKDVDKLRAGMTREQVLYVLGNPVARSSFADQRWEYLYTVRDGSEETARKRLSVIFADDKLVKIEGDYTQPAAFNDGAA